MTLDLHGCSFRVLVAESVPRELLRNVFSTYGLPVTDAEPDVTHGRISLQAVSGLPGVPAGMRRLGETIGITVWYEEGRFCLHTPWAVLFVHPSEGTVEGHVAAASHPDAWTWAVGPTLLSLFFLLRHQGFVPLHAAALVWRGGGLLASAASGAGKTTLACNLLRSGWAFLSDDTVLLRAMPEGVAAHAFRVHFSLTEDSRAVFPEFVPHWRQPAADAPKRWVPVGELFPDQATDRCLPRVLVFPERADEPTSHLLPVTKAEAVRLLAAQSMLPLFGRDGASEHLALLGRLARQCACYRLRAGRDLIDDAGRSHRMLAPLLEGVTPNGSPPPAASS